jgi:hypothetical protein
MLDELVLATLARLEVEDAAEREAGVPARERSRAVAPTTGRLLFALAAAQAGIEVLEIGGSRGYSSIWLAAGARVLGGRLVSLERDPAKCAPWRANIAAAGLEEWAELVEGDAHDTLARTEDVLSTARARRARRRRQRALARGDVGTLLGRAAGGRDAVERHRAPRPRSRALGRARLRRTPSFVSPPGLRRRRVSALPPSARSAYAGTTAERRWSGLSDDSTGSGGTSG